MSTLKLNHPSTEELEHGSFSDFVTIFYTFSKLFTQLADELKIKCKKMRYTGKGRNIISPC